MVSIAKMREQLLEGFPEPQADLMARVFVSAKAMVSVKEVKRFLTLVGRLRDTRPADDIRPLFFGYKADRRARDLIVASGAAMVFTRGVIIPLPPG